MAIPLLLQKMLNDDPWKWGVSAQYGVEFAPLVGVAVGLAFSRLRGGQPPAWVLLIAAGASMGVLVRFMDSTATFQDRSRIRFYQESHYTTGLDWRAARSVVSSLPREASVSAQSPAVPQLALRDSLYREYTEMCVKLRLTPDQHHDHKESKEDGNGIRLCRI